jgi:alpha/beta superfamily hydrolase
MNRQTEKLLLTGAAGQLECAIDMPEAAPRGIALLAHPHPLYGGTMDNKVVQTLARTFAGLGYVAVRMNFRGVEGSAGVHDEGHGETDDMYVLLTAMRERFPGLPVALAGFSFGTFVQGQLQQRMAAENMPAERLVLIGCAAGKWAMPSVPQDTILIHGEVDTTILLADVMDWARPQDIPVVVIPGCDHFFHRKLHHIRTLVSGLWHR